MSLLLRAQIACTVFSRFPFSSMGNCTKFE